MWVDIPWTSRGFFVVVWGSFSGSCRVSEPRLRLAWMGEGPKKKWVKCQFLGVGMSLCGSPRVTETRCGQKRTSERHFLRRKIVTFRVYGCPFVGMRVSLDGSSRVTKT